MPVVIALRDELEVVRMAMCHRAAARDCSAKPIPLYRTAPDLNDGTSPAAPDLKSDARSGGTPGDMDTGGCDMKFRVPALCAGLLVCAHAAADRLEVQVHKVNKSGVGKQIGTVVAEDTDHGVVLTPDLKGLPPGLHGFHLHEHPDCGPAEKDGKKTAAAAAGSHFDPDGEGEHNGPYRKGHLGDLPALYVDSDGRATLPVLAPKIEVGDLKGHALIIHEGGDTYMPKPELGGGGGRLACAAIES